MVLAMQDGLSVSIRQQPLILASTSRFRRALMDKLGLPYEAVAPDFDEIATPGEAPLACALRFAEGKAMSVLSKRPGSVVIGGDQTLEIEGQMLRKPETSAEAVEQLLRLSGKTHALHSGLALCRDGAEPLRASTTVLLTMRTLSRDEAERYVAMDDPIGSVGSYLFEKRGFSLFDEVQGADDSAIVGMPLITLARLLRQVGISLI